MRWQCDLLQTNKQKDTVVIGGTFVVCALVFHDNLWEVEQKKKKQKKKSNPMIKIRRAAEQNCTLKKGKQNWGAEMCYSGGGGEQNKQNGCPEMTNDLASKHTQ